MTWETVACCDDCWWDRSYGSEEFFKLPVRMKQEMRRIEACHFCGWTTYSGIFVRANTTDQPAAGLRVRKEN